MKGKYNGKNKNTISKIKEFYKDMQKDKCEITDKFIKSGYQQ